MMRTKTKTKTKLYMQTNPSKPEEKSESNPKNNDNFKFSIPQRLFSKANIMILFWCAISVLIIIQASHGAVAVASYDTPSFTTSSDIDKIAIESISQWSSTFGRGIRSSFEQITFINRIRDEFDPAKPRDDSRGPYKASIESIDWTRRHEDIARKISNMMGWHKNAVESISKAAEQFALNHTYDKCLRFDYIDVHRLQNINEQFDQPVDGMSPVEETAEPVNGTDTSPEDSAPPSTASTTAEAIESLPQPSSLVQSDTSQPSNYNVDPSSVEDPSRNGNGVVISTGTSSCPHQPGEWQTPIRYLKMSTSPFFGGVLVSPDESAVHVPVHLFAGESHIMNDIAWSEKLTKVFQENYLRNPKLHKQIFGAQSGILRIFPAQAWQVARTEPDLYDARMRAWYLAGASSRKDVIILVDSSGSMTGSRKDIARGVVFEILDTLTDNDHFLVLKFADNVEQVGVPSCGQMRSKQRVLDVAPKNTLYRRDSKPDDIGNNTDIDSFYLLPATMRNVRHVRSNFTITTSGIANFSQALVTAFEVLKTYQMSAEAQGSQCNQAIMLITDGSTSDFQEIFNRYNYPNAPVRVFTYLIGREAGDATTTKMMACHNRGFYTHVINLAEVREQVQQYIPVMARPLVLSNEHPVSWTSAYGRLTYQLLTDWVWESKRREKARAVWAVLSQKNQQQQQPQTQPLTVTRSRRHQGSLRVSTTGEAAEEVISGPGFSGTSSSSSSPEDYSSDLEALDKELEALDLFGHSDPSCFWESHQNDLLTTVVQPVYDLKNESEIEEAFLLKNVWTRRSSIVRTANLLGVAGADFRVNELMAFAPSHQLGPNAYPVMLTSHGFVMHHPDLRSILEPMSSDPSERNMNILKPFYSSVDLIQAEQVYAQDEPNLMQMRQDSVSGLVGWRKLRTKRLVDCQKRAQSRTQQFYYRPLKDAPYSLVLAIPQPYGAQSVKAHVDIKEVSRENYLKESLTTFFTSSDQDFWTVHPEYEYCEGHANNSITTLLDLFQRIENNQLDHLQWKPAESSKPPIYLPGKIVCDKDLIHSLMFDAIATRAVMEEGPPPAANYEPSSAEEKSLVSMYGLRFTFVSTRSGLTRVRLFESSDSRVKKEALAFAKFHSRAVDETYYSRTVDYNMLINDSATLIQVPFNAHVKIRDRFAQYEQEQLLGPVEDMNIYVDSGTSGVTEEIQNLNDTNASTASEDNNIKGLALKDMTFSQKLRILANSSIHVIATRSVVATEGSHRAVAAVTGLFYDYSSFVERYLNVTNQRFQDDIEKQNNNSDRKSIRCGYSDDQIDCLMIDNNGYIIVSENFDMIGRHLKNYDPKLMQQLLVAGLYHEINITDHQAICMRPEEKQTVSGCGMSTLFGGTHGFPTGSQLALGTLAVVKNLATSLLVLYNLLVSVSGFGEAHQFATPQMSSRQVTQANLALMPNKSYLRACDKTITLYEMYPGRFVSDKLEYYTNFCGCKSWFVYHQVEFTNLLMIIVESPATDSSTGDQMTSGANCGQMCDKNANIDTPNWVAEPQTEDTFCSNVEREAKLARKMPNSCYSHHPDEEKIKLCGSANNLRPSWTLVMVTGLIMTLSSTLVRFQQQGSHYL